MNSQKIEWKNSLIKSIIYRGITLVLGTLTAYLLTGSIAIATGTALLTEAVQAVNYFIYELIWSNIARRKLEKKILQQIKNKEINLKIDYTSILDLAYHISQIDTFVPKLYLSGLNIFKSMLENQDLEEVHDEIEKYKNHYVKVHTGRKMFFLSEEQ
ncbi:MAG: DUF2061 domain-containing protein [Promethearchaeota archaeon]